MSLHTAPERGIAVSSAFHLAGRRGTTDVGGVKELVGGAGVLVPAKDPKALSEAMLRVMKLPVEERHAMGKSARRRISQFFDMNVKAAEWEALYSHLLGDCR